MLNHHSLKLALLVVVFFSLATPQLFSRDHPGAVVPAPLPKTSKLKIEVKSDSKKIENATVILASMERGVRYNKVVRTNREGIVSVSTVPQGNLKVQVIARDYITFGQMFRISEDKQTLAISLRPSRH